MNDWTLKCIFKPLKSIQVKPLEFSHFHFFFNSLLFHSSDLLSHDICLWILLGWPGLKSNFGEAIKAQRVKKEKKKMFINCYSFHNTMHQ